LNVSVADFSLLEESFAHHVTLNCPFSSLETNEKLYTEVKLVTVCSTTVPFGYVTFAITVSIATSSVIVAVQFTCWEMLAGSG